MKKTLTVNLNGTVFHIDDDAYDVLGKYLSDIASHFSADEDKDDIMADIEARIAELFSERLQRNKEVVVLGDVQEIISIMGNPNQFSDEDEAGAPAEPERKKKRARRFYRDPESAFLGGVCGGIAVRFNWDVAIVRLALVGVTLFSGLFGGGWFFVLAYLMAWIIAPQAVTASQRLEMQGEDVTVENIKAEFDNLKNYVESENFKESTRSVGQRLGSIVKVVLKICFGFFGVVLAFAGFVVVLVLLALAMAAITVPPAILFDFAPDFIPYWNMLPLDSIVMMIISLLLIVGCPVFLLIYSLIRLASGHRSKSRTTYWIAVVLWLAGVFMLIGTAAKSTFDWHEQGGSVSSLSRNVSGAVVDQVRDVDGFHSLHVSGGFEVEITDSPNRLLLVNALEADMDGIKTYVEDGTLFIAADNVVLNNRLPKIVLSTQALEDIQVQGAVKIYSDFPLKGESLRLSLQGAGKVDLKVEMRHEVQVHAEGASSVKLSGDCFRLKLDAWGACKVEAEDLKARHAEVAVAGACSVKVYASESLNADASGAAKIDCKGSPKQVEKTDRIGARIRVE